MSSKESNPTPDRPAGEASGTHGGANRLSREKSPYLLQHQHNPVDWYPWGEEAFARARELDKPIFLSVGYATCHWCHVMERESFEDSDLAAHLNRVFVPVKVDREERPDVDDLYMTACQLLTGSGGWPLTVLLTPDLRPFFAGTYFPRESGFGRMGLDELVDRVETLWRDRREDALASAESLTRAIRLETGGSGGGSGNGGNDGGGSGDGEGSEGASQAGGTIVAPAGEGVETILKEEVLDSARAELARRFDRAHGGFGRAPKFPMAHTLIFLLRHGKRRGDAGSVAMARKTLDAMRNGGIFDQLGLGFHRYSTDEKWLLPHFEKMLYDQALLTLAYLEAAQVTGEAVYGQIAEEIISYVLRDLRSPQGAFYSAEDADSEGEEGRFYLFTARQIRETLPEGLAPLAMDAWGITEEGNFQDEASGRTTGANVLHRPRGMDALGERHGLTSHATTAHLEEARNLLLAHRDLRPRPLLDDKVLTDLNGLMIAALARGARVLKRPDLADAARGAADFLWSHLRRPTGDARDAPSGVSLVASEAPAASEASATGWPGEDPRLWHRHRDGESGIPGFLEDYAFFIYGLCELHSTTGDPALVQRALGLQRALDSHHWDSSSGGYFLTADDGERLLVRRKTLHDGAIPSGNSVSALNLLRLERLTGEAGYGTRAAALVRAFAQEVRQIPWAHGFFLLAVNQALDPGAGSI